MHDVNEVLHSKKQIVQEINVKIHPQKNDKLYYLNKRKLFSIEAKLLFSYQLILILKIFSLFLKEFY
jgi:hypothetical protein